MVWTFFTWLMVILDDCAAFINGRGGGRVSEEWVRVS